MYFIGEGNNRDVNHSKEHSSYQSSKYPPEYVSSQGKAMRLRTYVIFPSGGGTQDSDFTSHGLFLCFINWELFAQMQTNKGDGIGLMSVAGISS